MCVLSHYNKTIIRSIASCAGWLRRMSRLYRLKVSARTQVRFRRPALQLFSRLVKFIRQFMLGSRAYYGRARQDCHAIGKMGRSVMLPGRSRECSGRIDG